MTYRNQGSARTLSQPWTRAAVVCLVSLVSLAVAAGPAMAGERSVARVSVRADGGESAAGSSFDAALSADGRFVAFASDASDLVDGDTNAASDVFVRDLASGDIERVSVGAGVRQGDGGSSAPSISSDGRFVVFSSASGNLVDGDSNEVSDVFLHDRQTGETTRLSIGPGGAEGDDASWGGRISGDGRSVAFTSRASTLATDDGNAIDDIFVRDRETGVTARVSIASDGRQANGASASPSVSADGRWVVYESFASNLVDDGPQGFWAIYLHDQETGETTLLSVAANADPANEDSTSPAISADGRFVAYSSLARNLTADSPQGYWGIYLHDREAGVTTLLTTALGGGHEDGDSYAPTISADGGWVAFHSTASNLAEGDANALDDVFLHGRESGQTTRLSVPDLGGEANDHSGRPTISSDGQVVAFESWAANLVDGDTNAAGDVFVSVPG